MNPRYPTEVKSSKGLILNDSEGYFGIDRNSAKRTKKFGFRTQNTVKFLISF